MRITLPLAYQPHPGATITATLIHNMVDNAVLDNLEQTETAVSGAVASASGASGAHSWVLYAPDVDGDRQLTWAPRTEISLTQTPHWLAKTYAAYFFNDQGYVPYKGLPCLVPADYDSARGNWSGMAASTYSLGGWWHLPRITLDNICWFQWHADYGGTVHPEQKYYPGIWGVVAETSAGANSLVKVVEHGYCDALIHASLSSNLSGPGVYALQYNFANNDQFPVATQTLAPTDEAVTITEMPLGLVRKVFTESGITLLPYVYENESSATNVPYYVARVFFSGFGCL